MDTHRAQDTVTTLMSLETAAANARSGFGCMFSTSDEYETAVIAERRAQGRYMRSASPWPAVMFLGCTLIVVGTVMVIG